MRRRMLTFCHHAGMRSRFVKQGLGFRICGVLEGFFITVGDAFYSMEFRR